MRLVLEKSLFYGGIFLSILCFSPVRSFGEDGGRFGLDNLLQGNPDVAASIRPSGYADVAAGDLQTPSRSPQSRAVFESNSATPVRTAVAAPQQLVIDWRALREQAQVISQPQAQQPAEIPQEPPREIRPMTARERLLFSAGASIPDIVSIPSSANRPSDRLVRGVSDLNRFRAQALSSDTSFRNPMPSSRDFPRHNPGMGRARARVPVHSQGYAAP